MFSALHQRPGDDQELCRQLDLHLQLNAALKFTSFDKRAEVAPDGRIQGGSYHGRLHQGIPQRRLTLLGYHRRGAVAVFAASGGAQVKASQSQYLPLVVKS